MFLLVGLGNYGSEYAHNRHNIGFMAVDHFADKSEFGAWKRKFQGQLGEGKIGRHRFICLKPETYMNLSGQSVSQVAHFYKIPLENIIVFHDDLDLAAGKIRVKKGGGHGGHNGLRSIDSHMGADYHRVRMGIGRPATPEAVHSYVLNDFSKAERVWLDPLLDALAKHLPLLLDGNEAGYMNKIALATQPPKPEKASTKAEKPSEA